MARPSKLTADVQARVVQAIMAGATYEHAAMYGGIAYRTFAEWMQKGAGGREPYAQFVQAVKDAEGAAAVANLAHIRKAASDGTWQAAAWLLERRYPEMYGRQRHEHSGPGGGPIQTEDVTEIDKRALAILKALQAIDGSDDE